LLIPFLVASLRFAHRKVRTEGKEGQLVFTLDKKLQVKKLDGGTSGPTTNNKPTVDSTPPTLPSPALAPAVIGVTESFGSWGTCVGYLHRIVKTKEVSRTEEESTSTATSAWLKANEDDEKINT